jgi:acetyltransferase
VSTSADLAIQIHPMRPDDRTRITDAIAYTSEDTYYRRFHTPMSGFTERELKQLTEIDGDRHIALVATERDQPERLVSVVRCVCSRLDPSEAEFAIIVHDPYQRRGIGAHMLRLMIETAREHGITRMRALIQSDNRAMLALLFKVMPQAVLEDRAEGVSIYVADITQRALTPASRL